MFCTNAANGDAKRMLVRHLFESGKAIRAGPEQKAPASTVRGPNHRRDSTSQNLVATAGNGKGGKIGNVNNGGDSAPRSAQGTITKKLLS